MSETNLLGALVGWTRNARAGGTVLKLETASSHRDLSAGRIERHFVVLTTNQMRVLALDLIKGADEIEGKVASQPRKRWFKR